MKWLLVLLVAACVENNAPEIEDFTPSQGAPLNGAGTVVVAARLSDESPVRAELFAQGESLGVFKQDSCESCTLAWEWATRDLPAGDYVVELLVEDAHGNETSEAHTVRIDDMITVKSIEVKNMTDESGLLEIEVYLFDDTTGAMRGCAGGRHGLASVDVSNVRYTVDATLIDRTIRPIGALSFQNAPAHIEVWEDDDDPICPEALSKTGNDLVGVAPVMTWAPHQTMSFGNVVSLEVEMSRPLRLVDAPEPMEQPPGGSGGSGSFGDGGCNSGGANGFVLVLLVLTSAGRFRASRSRRPARGS